MNHLFLGTSIFLNATFIPPVNYYHSYNCLHITDIFSQYWSSSILTELKYFLLFLYVFWGKVKSFINPLLYFPLSRTYLFFPEEFGYQYPSNFLHLNCNYHVLGKLPHPSNSPLKLPHGYILFYFISAKVCYFYSLCFICCFFLFFSCIQLLLKKTLSISPYHIISLSPITVHQLNFLTMEQIHVFNLHNLHNKYTQVVTLWLKKQKINISRYILQKIFIFQWQIFNITKIWYKVQFCNHVKK